MSFRTRGAKLIFYNVALRLPHLLLHAITDDEVVIRERSSLIKLPDGATVTELRADLQDVITLPVIQNSEKRLNIQQQI